MKIFFSFDYKAGQAYLGMQSHPVMMDTQLVDHNKLIDFLELRLGLHTETASDADRLVAYYKCVRTYMDAHKADPDNQLYNSYDVSPLATSREMLKWRDALTASGWTQNTPAPSKRLKVLQGVEQLYASQASGDLSQRQQHIIDRLKEKPGSLNDVTFVLPYPVKWLHPVLQEIFALAQADGACLEQLEVPAINGNNNLAKLKKLLTAEGVERTTLDPSDPSVRIWNFKDEMQAEEYLAMLPDDTFDVIIQPDTKLTDNYLHMMGKPVTGSAVANSAPQIIQLFFTGVALLSRPLNVSVLMQWLYASMSPLPGRLRYRLAERLARNGGWCAKDTDMRGQTCYQVVQNWIAGTDGFEEDKPLTPSEKAERQRLADVFLPDFDGGMADTLSVGRLHTFLTALSRWSKQRATMLAQTDADDLRIAQLGRLSELCTILQHLTDNYQPTDNIAYSEIEKHMACLYEPTEFVQYRAQATARFTVSTPGQVVAPCNQLLWAGLYNFEPMRSDTDFLTPTEVEELQNHLQLWHPDNVRKLQQATLLLPLLNCQQQLTLVTLQTVGSDTVNKHPLIVRIEQQVTNHQQLTSTPTITEASYVSVSPLTNSEAGTDQSIYATLHRTDLIHWKEQESATSLENLIQNPIDYALEHIAYISDNGQSTLRNLATTKGNVAHAVIQHLFLQADDTKSGYPAVIRARVSAHYDQVFNNIVEAQGAILLLPEYTIERRQLADQLRDCIDHLLNILEEDHLHVTACEMQLNGPLGTTDDEDTLQMCGYADMVLARENGDPLIFDFKWTSSNSYYQGLLQKNTSSQLAIYAHLLEQQEHQTNLPTAYFLMPVGILCSTHQFASRYATQLNIDDGCEGDLISKIRASYRYRREEIESGKLENGEGCPLENIEYYNATEAQNLFPLKPQYKQEDQKAVNDFSNYKHLKN